MAYTKYSLTPANNTAAPPDGAPEGMLPSAVNDTMRDMMAQIRDAGDGIRNGTYTMTAPVITGGSITGVALSGNTLTNPVITGGSINNTTVGATTRSTGAFTTLASNGATTFTAGTASTSTTTGTAVITGGLGVSGRINAANFDGIVGANTAAAGNFTTLGATGVATFSAGTVSAPAITTTGDTNTGIFFPAADTIAFTEGGVESMRITSTGKVGIGTNNPSFQLDVLGATGDGVRYSDGTVGNVFGTSGGGGLIGTITNHFVAFYSNAAERMRIDSAGNVGIGTSSPAQILEVSKFNSGALSTALSLINPAGNVANTGVELRMSGTQVTSRYAYIQATASSGTNGHFLRFGTNAAGATPVDQMIIYSDGIVGTRAGIELGNVASVNQDVYIDFHSIASGTTDFETRINRASGANGAFDIYNTGTGNFTLNQSGAAPMIFATSATERMRIDSSGNVGIGTSSPASKLGIVVSPAAGGSSGISVGDGTRQLLMQITGSTYSYNGVGANENLIYAGGNPLSFLADGQPIKFCTGGERMRIDSSGNLLVGTTTNPDVGKVAIAFVPGSTQGLVFKQSINTSEPTPIMFFNAANSVVGSVITSATTTVYNTSSDYRLKENILPITGALNKVAMLKPCVYTWKANGSSGQGFIAHELAEVCPDAVTGSKDAVNKDGSIKAQGIDTSFLVATLTAAIQEQQTLIENLTTRLNALEGK